MTRAFVIVSIFFSIPIILFFPFNIFIPTLMIAMMNTSRFLNTSLKYKIYYMVGVFIITMILFIFDEKVFYFLTIIRSII